MRSFMCGCGRKYLFSDIGRCPYCNKDLLNHTDEYARKHLHKCQNSIGTRVYSDRYVGRPSKKEVEETLSNRTFVKHCRNCGKPFCRGIDEGVCDEWEPKRLGRCPCCGLMPILVEKCGTYAIICDGCNLKMSDEDKDALLTRWAKLGMN